MRTMAWWAAAVLLLAAGAGQAQVEQYPGTAGTISPIGVVVGSQVSDSLTLDVGVDIPVLFSITNPFGVVFGPLAGVGGEYYVDRNLAVTARIRVGPEVSLNHNGSSSDVGVQTLIGVAYNMR